MLDANGLGLIRLGTFRLESVLFLACGSGFLAAIDRIILARKPLTPINHDCSMDVKFQTV